MRADEARLQEVLRLRKENFDTHGGADTRDARQLVPGRSWAAWSRALGLLLPPLQVADLGCGEGYLTIEAARWASRVIAVDRSEVVLERARGARRPPPRLERHLEARRAREAADRRTRSVDVALLSQALHHAARPGAGRRRSGARSPCPAAACWCSTCASTSEEWVRAKLGDRALGFRRRRAEADADRRRPDRRQGRVGARKTGDPFTVLVAAGDEAGCRRTDATHEDMQTP